MQLQPTFQGVSVRPIRISGVVCSLLLLGFSAACGPSRTTSHDKGPEPTHKAAVSATSHTAADYDFLKKMDSQLQRLFLIYTSGGNVKQSAEAAGLQVNERNEVLIDVYVTNSVLQASSQFESQGMTVLATNEGMGVVEGLLPIRALLAVARADFTKAVLAVKAVGTTYGSGAMPQ